MKNQKKTGELKFRDYFGTTAMSVTDGLASTVMTGLFMLYLTDYARHRAMGRHTGQRPADVRPPVRCDQRPL